MTSYITITDAETDPEAPLTSELAKKWRDNPVAIAEKDATVPSTLRLGKWKLGDFATTSGSSISVSGLSLTDYTSLELVLDGVRTTNTASVIRLVSGSNSINLTLQPRAAVSTTFFGLFLFDLTSSSFVGGSGHRSGAGSYAASTQLYNAGFSGITTATTSFTIDITGGGSFDAGKVTVYGVR